MMRVLCVAAYYKPAHVYGGPVRSISALCEGLVENGVEVAVFTSNANGNNQIVNLPTGTPFDVNGVQVWYFPILKLIAEFAPYYFFSRQLYQACQNHMREYDVVYIPGNWTYPFYASVTAAIKQDVPYVVSPRGSFMDWSMKERPIKKNIYLTLIERKLIDHASAIHVTSSLEAEQLGKWGFKPQIANIPNGIDLAPHRNLPRRGKLRQELSLHIDDTLSVFVGRIHKMKRPQLMIEAFSQVVKHNTNAHLLIVGPDQDSSGTHIREIVDKNGLNSQVHFTGLLTGSDLLQVYADADLLVLLSHRENFGMVVVEAMASGLPVLISDDVGLSSDVRQVDAGFIVHPDVKAVSQEWLRLLADNQLRQEMGIRGKGFAYATFSNDVIAKQMHELFISAIRSSTRRLFKD